MPGPSELKIRARAPEAHEAVTREVLTALTKAGGDRSRAAEALGVHRATLLRVIADVPGLRDAVEQAWPSLGGSWARKRGGKKKKNAA